MRARVRARASGGNRFTWISIIVIKHAASMNYLFVGTAECTTRTESKKKRKRKGRKDLRWRRRRNTYRRILQRLLDAFVLLQLDGEFAKEEEEKKGEGRKREGEK